MDEGALTDSQGRKVDFKNTIIVMTSNLGAEAYLEDLGDGEISQETKASVQSAVKHHFSPEFLNRIDDLIVFNRLGRESLRKIVDIRINELKERLSHQNLTVIVEDEAKDWLGQHGYDVAFGARPLSRLIQKKIMNPLAKKLIDNKIKDGDTVHVVKEGNDLALKV